MGKLLFSMEEAQDSSNDLLIDKIIKQTKKPEEPLSLTTDIIKQRQELKKEIAASLSESSDDEESSEENPEDTEEDTEEVTEEEEDDSSDDKSKEKEPDDEDIGEDEDSIDDVMGSGLSAGDDDFRDEDKDKKEEKVAEEAITNLPKSKLNLNEIFLGVNVAYEEYVKTVSRFGFESDSKGPTSKPVVIVKESLLEAVDKILEASKVYVDNSDTFIGNATTAATKVNEKLTIFTSLVEAEQYRFTHKFADEKDILEAVSTDKTSSPRDTIKVLIKYITDTSQAVVFALDNSFDNLPDSFTQTSFEQEEQDLVYKHMLPGFNMVRVHIDPYTNFLEVKINEFELYKLKVMKTEDLYDLDSIGITSDGDLEYIVKAMNDLLASMVTIVDNLTDLNTNFEMLISQIKVIRHDLEEDTNSDLSSIGIDSKVQDFIRFKLAIETFNINYNLISDYLTGLFAVLNIVVELKE